MTQATGSAGIENVAERTERGMVRELRQGVG